METVQKLVPYFQELLQQWYELTLHNQEYVICLAVFVFLITAFFYSIRIGFLKRSNAQIQKAKNETQASLDESRQQLQTLQQQYNEANERMQQAVEKAELESQRLQASNKQLANSLAGMVDCFELNLHNLPTADTDNLLTEYDTVLSKVFERFQAEQQAKTKLQLSFHAESAKLAEKEMMVSSLQNRLDTQTQQLAKLELAIEHYEDAQRQLEADKDQLAKETKKHQAEVARALELEKQQVATTLSQAQKVMIESNPESVKQPDSDENAVEIKQPELEPVKSDLKPQMPNSEASAAGAKSQTEKPQTQQAKTTKGVFGRALEKIAKMDEKLGSSSHIIPKSESADEVRAEVSEPIAESLPAADNKKPHQNQGVGQKLSGLFGGFKKSSGKQPKAEKSQSVSASVREEDQNVVANEPATKVNEVTSKISGLFGKLKSKK